MPGQPVANTNVEKLTHFTTIGNGQFLQYIDSKLSLEGYIRLSLEILKEYLGKYLITQ